MTAKLFTCPVCGYDKLDKDPAPLSYEICPHCGTEFGYDDAFCTHAELRERWLDRGSKCWGGEYCGCQCPPAIA